MTGTMIPPKQVDYEEGQRFPYANQLIQLSFEGRLKPFNVPPTRYGRHPSYAPAVPATASRKLEITQGDLSFLDYWRSKLTHPR